LTPDFIELAASGFPFQVERFYAALTLAAAPVFHPADQYLLAEASISSLKSGASVVDAASTSDRNPVMGPDLGPDLGGQLLYAGELDAQASALVVAANIAGAATLAVSAEAGAQRQAIRDGVVDFVVNSLDEALRILKNEIRKRETVAVCVAVAPDGCESDFALEMLERGVRPDLLGPGGMAAGKLAALIPPGLARIEPADASADQVFVAWSVAKAPAVWLPALDKIAVGCLSPEAWAARRWLRLAPRYMGRIAHGVRILRCDAPTAQCFQQQVREGVERGEIGVPVEIQSFPPPTASICAQSSFTP
jgi:urocanate hydratase